jgi:hypothetical protein
LWFFSDNRPTLTSDGAYFHLAELLVEAVTGVEGVSVERACRRIFRLTDELGPPILGQEFDQYQRVLAC